MFATIEDWETFVRSMARKFHIDRNQMLYVGDELRDVQACKKIGLK